MFQKLFICTLFLGLLNLVGCKGDLAPLLVQITPQRNFDLIANDGSPVPFTAGTSLSAVASFEGTHHRVVLNVAGHKIELHKAHFDAHTDLITALPSESQLVTSTGERIGVTANRQLICNPNCEIVRSHVETHSCQYTVTAGYYCGWYYNSPGCLPNIAVPTVFGTQDVEVRVIDRSYRIHADLQGERQGELAQIEGIHNERSLQERPLTPCR